MKSWLLKLGFFLVFSSVHAMGQATDHPDSKFGKAFEAYEIRPGIMVRIQKAADGQVSEIRLEPFSGTGSSVKLDNKMDAYIVKSLIDELVPIEERGEPKEFFGLTLLLGQCWVANYDYEYVSIELSGGINMSESKKAQPETTGRRKSNNPFPSAEVIIIKWKNRKT